MHKPSKKWNRMKPIYRYFAGESDTLDFSDTAAWEMFRFETTGVGNLKIGLFNTEKLNGYAIGKHWMDVTLALWLQDLREGVLYIEELYNEYPDWHWWLNRCVLKPLQK